MKKKTKNKTEPVKKRLKIHIILLSLIILSSFFIRMINIDWGISKDLPGYSYIPDEPYGHASAIDIKPFSGEIDPGEWAMQKGTFYYELVGTTNQLLEFSGLKAVIFPEIKNNPSTSYYYEIILARFITIIISLLTILLVYLLTNLLFKNKNISLLAAFTYSLFAQEIPFSHMVLGDKLVALLVISSLYFCISSYQKKNPKILIYAGFLGGLAMATKYTAFLTTLPIAISFFMQDNKIIKKNLEKIPLIILTFIIGFFIGEPQALINFSTFIDGLLYQQKYQVGRAFLPGQEQLPRFIFYFSNVFLYGIGLIFTLLSLIGTFYYLIKNRSKEITYILFSFILPYYAMLSLANWITTRYTFPLTPLFAIFIAYLLFDILNKITYKKIALAGFTIIYIYGMGFTFNIVEAIHQPDVQQQFKEHEKNQMKLSEEKAEITFLLKEWAPFTHPVNPDYAVEILTPNDIKNNPEIAINTKYILVSNDTIRDYRRVNDKEMVKFLDRLEKTEFKLLNTFEKKFKIPYINNSDAFYSSDLNILFQKYYLYEKI